ncbi:MAG: hypothetical protein J0L93_09275 [Deltaproteobacteria bacterium]|nr:hypothetical protein [Deltaproteobacteria bacterium]
MGLLRTIRPFIFVLLIPKNLMAIEPYPVPFVYSNVPCNYWLRELSSPRKYVRLWKFNSAETDRIIYEVSGISFKSKPNPFRTKEDLIKERAIGDRDLKTMQEWFSRYAKYNDEMNILTRALNRYRGEDLSQTSSERNTDLDSLRAKGRIKIFEEHLENPQTKFPLTISFPRAPREIAGDVSLQRMSSLLVQHTFKDKEELWSFLNADKAEADKIEIRSTKREIEQAELYVRIRQFREVFPKGSYRMLTHTFKNSPELKNDPDYAKDYALVELFQKASLYIRAPNDQIQKLLPTERALQFIDSLTKADASNGFIRASSRIDTARQSFIWVTGPIRLANGLVEWGNKPIKNWGALTVLLGALGGWLTWTNINVVTPVHDWIVFDSSEKEAYDYWNEIQKVRSIVSIPANNWVEFHKNFYEHFQPIRSDPAITIFIQHQRGIRPELKADPILDPEIPVDRLDGYTKEAKSIQRVYDILIKGYKTPFGSFSGVEEKLGRRGYNIWQFIDLGRQRDADNRSGKWQQKIYSAPVEEAPAPAVEEQKPK